jgi:hypothetical protein
MEKYKIFTAIPGARFGVFCSFILATTCYVFAAVLEI